MGRLRAVAAGVRRDGGRGPGRRPLRPRTAAAADRAGPHRDRALRLRASPPRAGAAAGRRRALPAAAGRRPRAPSSWRPRCPRRWACSAAGRRRAWSSRPRRGETVLLYTDGLLHRTGEPMRPGLRAAARGGGERARGAAATTRTHLRDHVLRTCLPDGPGPAATSRRGRHRAAGRALRLTGRQPSAGPRPGASSFARPRIVHRPAAPVRSYAWGESRTTQEATQVQRGDRRGRGAADGEPRTSSRSSSARTASTRRVSDELAEIMKSGWADTELRDLAPDRAGRRTPPRAAPRCPRASPASGW